MPEWEYMSVKVALEPGKGMYRVLRGEENEISVGNTATAEESPLLTDFLVEASRLGWVVEHSSGDTVLLKRSKDSAGN